MDRMMWFATRRYGRWIPEPQTGQDFGEQGYGNSVGFRNGGAMVLGSVTGHKEYNFAWGPKPVNQMRAVIDFANYQYGPGPFYFTEPMAFENALPSYVANPSMIAEDAPNVFTSSSAGYSRIAYSDTPGNVLDYPVVSARFDVGVGNYGTGVYLSIPPGYSAWISAHGSATGDAGIDVTPYLGYNQPALSVRVPILPVVSPIRGSVAFNGDAYMGIEIGTGGTGQLTLSGMMVQMVPNGRQPSTGGFVSGQGHSGCTFETKPSQTPYSAVLGPDGNGLIGVSAKLVETGAWSNSAV